jgi:hypothetical protein
VAKQIESTEAFPGENGGHRVVHNFKREAGKKDGRFHEMYPQEPIS